MSDGKAGASSPGKVSDGNTGDSCVTGANYSSSVALASCKFSTSGVLISGYVYIYGKPENVSYRRISGLSFLASVSKFYAKWFV